MQHEQHRPPASHAQTIKMRMDPDLAPGRWRPRHAVPKVNPLKRPLAFLRTFNLPNEAFFEKGRQYSIMGDPLADDFAALYPVLGAKRARGMLDTALERGIDAVPDAPQELKALFAQLDRVPAWVDWARVERGAAVMRRYAPMTWMFMRLAFAQTFVNANAGTPLYMTGSLTEKTAAKRLHETSKWRLEIQQPGALRRDGEGFKTVVRVRILHSLIRYFILRSGKWDAQSLGMPIPQLDMAGANMGMFLTHSALPRLFGARITNEEYLDVMHTWRYHGYLIGLDDELNPDTHRSFKRTGSLIGLTLREAFDPRGRELTRATMNARLREGGLLDRLLDEFDSRAAHGLYFLVNGPTVYRKMGLDAGKMWLWILPAMFPYIFVGDTVRKHLPGGSQLAAEVGRRYIANVLENEHVKRATFNPYPS